MPTILLVRHAQASFGGADYDALSPRGVEQAAVLARDLAARGIAPGAVVSGSLVRQRRTAEPIAAAAGVPVTIDPRWNEYAADDILTHHSATELRLEHPRGGERPVSPRDFQIALDAALLDWVQAGASSPAAESWPAFTGRVEAALDELAGTLGRGETALACTSGGVLAAACVALLGVPAPTFVAFNRVAVNTGLSRVVRGGRGTTLLSFNEHAHLPRAQVTYR